MSVDTENAIAGLIFLSGVVLATMLVTEGLCRHRVARKKPVSYWLMFAGASFVPISAAIIAICADPKIWSSHAGKSSPEAILTMLGVLGVLCLLPAFVVVRRNRKKKIRAA